MEDMTSKNLTWNIAEAVDKSDEDLEDGGVTLY